MNFDFNTKDPSNTLCKHTQSSTAAVKVTEDVVLILILIDYMHYNDGDPPTSCMYINIRH